MRVLLTGASSFTGFWFATELARAGHEVTATFRGTRQSYADTRAGRVSRLADRVDARWESAFGGPKFLDLVSAGGFDLFCHHASEMTNYRSWEFDPLAASAANTLNARKVLAALTGRGCRAMVFTGSVFEPYEGIGDPEQRSLLPYGLSKHISYEVFRLEAERIGLRLGKFVIPNPFGPFEEMRFTSYAAREWSKGATPSVTTPDYVRDNIHVSLLALRYAAFSAAMGAAAGGALKCAPSGYAESQGAFALRFAREIGACLGKELPMVLQTQTDFAEPRTRVNSEPSASLAPGWSEKEAWATLAEYYRERFPPL